MTRLITVGVGVCILAIAGVGRAQPPEGLPAGGPEARMSRMAGAKAARGQQFEEMFLNRIINSRDMAKEVGLGEEQVKTLREALYDLKKKNVDLRAAFEKAGIEQARLMTEDTVDEEAVMAAVEKKYDFQKDMAKLRVKQLLTIRKTLTPEQLNKVREMIHQRRGEFDERRDARRRERGEQAVGRRDGGRAEKWRKRGRKESPDPEVPEETGTKPE